MADLSKYSPRNLLEPLKKKIDSLLRRIRGEKSECSGNA